MRSLHNLRNVSLGFHPENRIEVLISLPRIHYQHDADVVRFFQQVGEGARTLPGVLDASVTYPLPLQNADWGTSFKKVEGSGASEEFTPVDLRLIDSHTLAALSIPLLRGRVPADSDRSESELICLISKTMAQQYWPGEDPLGHLLMLARNDVNGHQKPWRIVGIAGDVRRSINEDPQPAVYVPYAQMSFFNMELLLHTHESPAAVRKSVMALLQAIDPDQPIRSIHALSTSVTGAFEDWRLAITLLGLLAGIAVFLTTIGVFAVMACMVREKTREIGIRMAIGATQGAIRNFVLRQTAVLVLLGCICGLAASALCTRYLGSLVYGIRTTDPLTLVLVSFAISAIALLASYIPARRAMRVDPMIALRNE